MNVERKYGAMSKPCLIPLFAMKKDTELAHLDRGKALFWILLSNESKKKSQENIWRLMAMKISEFKKPNASQDEEPERSRN